MSKAYPKFRKNQKNAKVRYNCGSDNMAVMMPIEAIIDGIAAGKINWVRHSDGTQSFWRASTNMVSYSDFKAGAA